MTRDIAVNLSREVLARKSIQNFEYLRAFREGRNNQSLWVVVFGRKKDEGTIVTPDRIFVEVDEATAKATIERSL